MRARRSGAAAAAAPRFWPVVAQIVVLDAVFSLDSVITAVGMVDELYVMMAAVIIAVVVMLFASEPLTRFINARPSLIILCLGFLLMIGLVLVVDGLGVHVPKGYVYAAIGFSVLIEALNQTARAQPAQSRRCDTAAPRVRRTRSCALSAACRPSARARRAPTPRARFPTHPPSRSSRRWSGAWCAVCSNSRAGRSRRS